MFIIRAGMFFFFKSTKSFSRKDKVKKIQYVTVRYSTYIKNRIAFLKKNLNASRLSDCFVPCRRDIGTIHQQARKNVYFSLIFLCVCLRVCVCVRVFFNRAQSFPNDMFCFLQFIPSRYLTHAMFPAIVSLEERSSKGNK